jgi:methionyl-tRNA synthetase
MGKNSFYITTPVYYANAQPHIGHAYTTVAADTIVRFKKALGVDAFLLTGMDEHGAKIAQKAKQEAITPQELVDDVSDSFKNLWKQLDIDYDAFTRTTDTKHKKFIQDAVQKLYEQGIIYKGEYEGKYCVGCEQFKNESDLVDGKCPDHNTEPEIMSEESYLMKMGEQQEWLVSAIKNDEFKIRPERYKNEILAFLENNKLEDLSISRKNVEWGIPLPFDDSHTTYVWFDAFLSYVTGAKFWPSDINLIGKDILRVHATIWPIMLKHLELDISKGLFVHGHILSEGKKMSKTLGNVIGIDEMLEKFGTDATRYLLLSIGSFGEDVDATMERLTEKYNADLANGLGNLLSRVVTLNSRLSSEFKEISFSNDKVTLYSMKDKKHFKNFEKFRFDLELHKIMTHVQVLNKYIEDNKPWEIAETDSEKFKAIMEHLSLGLGYIANSLLPFMPETAEKIKQQLETGEKEILFERIK